MALTPIALCARALLMIGANSIASFDEGTAESEVAANLYPSLRDALLSLHPWNFALRRVTLARVAAEGEDPADSSTFALPSECLRVVSVTAGEGGRVLSYRVMGRTVVAHTQTAVLTHVARVSESEFPASFDQALIARLAAEFCLPLTESASRAEFLRKAAEEELRRARFTDAQEDTPQAFEDFVLVEARG